MAILATSDELVGVDQPIVGGKIRNSNEYTTIGLVQRYGGEPVPLLGLPGNPVVAMIAFEVFARPAILKLGGHTNWQKPAVRAILDEDITNSGRRHYRGAQVRREADGYHVTTRGSGVKVQGSGILSSLVWANGLVVVPEEVTCIKAGNVVEVWMLDWPASVF